MSVDAGSHEASASGDSALSCPCLQVLGAGASPGQVPPHVRRSVPRLAVSLDFKLAHHVQGCSFASPYSLGTCHVEFECVACRERDELSLHAESQVLLHPRPVAHGDHVTSCLAEGLEACQVPTLFPDFSGS